MTPLPAYSALAGSAFLAATVFPAQSELVLGALLLEGEHSPALLLAVATFANTAGALVNWALGRVLAAPWAWNLLRITPERLARARRLYERWGAWSLLFAWLPIVGDPLTVAAGAMKLKLAWFLPLVAVGKAARYAALAFAVLNA